MSNQIDMQEWSRLNKAVHAVCNRLIRNPAEFSIADQFDGVVSQRVEICEPKLLTPRLMIQLSKAVADSGLLGAQVDVVFDFSKCKPGATSLKGLLIATATSVELPIFDLPALRKQFGPSFYLT